MKQSLLCHPDFSLWGRRGKWKRDTTRVHRSALFHPHLGLLGLPLPTSYDSSKSFCQSKRWGWVIGGYDRTLRRCQKGLTRRLGTPSALGSIGLQGHYASKKYAAHCPSTNLRCIVNCDIHTALRMCCMISMVISRLVLYEH